MTDLGLRRLGLEKIVLGIMLLICIGAAVMLAGCKHKEEIVPSTEDMMTGGKKDNTNYDAPKEIKSDELVFFETEFYRNSDFIYDKSRNYRFKMTKSEGDVFVLTEGYDEQLKCETEGTFSAKLQQIIKEYDLPKLNGIEKQTYGLPEEYAPYWVSAEYASGEKLYFFMDGNPNEGWTGVILDLFAKEFGNHGIDDLLPPKEESLMTRFSLEYTFGDIKYSYGEIWVPVTEEEKDRSLEDILTNGANKDDCVKKVYAEVWDRIGKTELGDDRMADITEEYYLALQEIVEDTELFRIQNGNIFPGGFDYDNTPQYYEFYIEYESGKRMSGFSDDVKQCEESKKIAERFSQYYDEYLERNKE